MLDRLRGLARAALTLPFSLLSLSALFSIAAATLANSLLSRALFRIAYAQPMQEAYIATDAPDRFSALRLDYFRMRKMSFLWPPFTEDFFLFAALYTMALFFLLTRALVPLAKDEEDSKKEKDDAFLALSLSSRVTTAILTGIFNFVLLLPMQRLGELHTLVLLMNAFHHVFSASLSTVIFSAVLGGFARWRQRREAIEQAQKLKNE